MNSCAATVPNYLLCNTLTLCVIFANSPPNFSYALYFVVVATLICHLWSASLYIKLRDFDITDLAGFKKHNDMAGTVAKAGLITEVIMVCLVRVHHGAKSP